MGNAGAPVGGGQPTTTGRSVESARLCRDRRVQAVAAATAVLCAVRIADGTDRSGKVAFLAATIFGALLAAVGVRRRPAAERTTWLLVALGMAMSAAADVTAQVITWVRGEEPQISVAEVGWIGSYVLLAAGLITLEARHRSGRRAVDSLLDTAAVAIVSLLLVWVATIVDTVTDTSLPLGVRAIWSTYPILDVVLLALVARMLFSRRARSSTAVILVGGVMCWLVADFAYMAIAADPGVGRWLDLGWMVGAVLLGLAAWAPSDGSPFLDDPSDDDEEHVGVMRIGLLLAAVVTPQLVDLWATERGHPLPSGVLLVTTLALVTLAFARSFRLLLGKQRVQGRLRASERYFRALAANSSDAVLVVDEDGRIMNDAPNLAHLVGLPNGVTTVGASAFDHVEPDDLAVVADLVDRALASPGEVFTGEVRVRHPDGHGMWLSGRVVNLLDDPEVGGIVVNLHDVTDRKRAEEELAHQAFHDGLTGLANRGLFGNRVDHAIRRSARDEHGPAVLFLDLDGFKVVNDSLGHETGDALLCEVARRLTAVVRAGDTAARLGGDEFAVLVEQATVPGDEAVVVAERLLQVLAEPIVIDGQRLSLTASIGIAVHEPGETGSVLLRNADVAMYRAKHTGKAQWVRFEADMRLEAVERLQLESDLAGALERGELTVLYQPVVDLDTTEVVGFEALLRWDHPELGRVLPERFIPIAEDNGTIVPIGRHVLRTACETMAAWQHELHGERSLTMAVNLSARQLASADLVDDVRQVLEDTGIEPANLVLEMTETVLVKDAATAASRLAQLHALGVRLAIDDFGTGYSSLTYLRQFPVDILKIDRTFVSSISDGMQAPAIIRGLIDLGRTLRLEMVAEGIEEDVQRAWLRAEQCTLGQGYLFAHPLSDEEAHDVLLSPLGVARSGFAAAAMSLS